MKKRGLLWVPVLTLLTGYICFLLSPSNAVAELLFKETFDTATTSNAELYDTRFSNHQVTRGNLALFYSSLIKSPPSGIECTLPVSSLEPDWREIDLSFLGGEMEMSNSLDIVYEVGRGDGLCLAPLHYNVSSDKRTGYILRFLRHGDGTNEMIAYRNDTGWTKYLKNEWVPSNPTTTLRHVVIRHRKNGEHDITATFDTGSTFDRTLAFDDPSYPPNNVQRGLQFIATGYGAVQTTSKMKIAMDTWMVTDASMSFPPSPNKKNEIIQRPKQTNKQTIRFPGRRDFPERGRYTNMAISNPPKIYVWM